MTPRALHWAMFIVPAFAGRQAFQGLINPPIQNIIEPFKISKTWLECV